MNSAVAASNLFLPLPNHQVPRQSPPSPLRPLQPAAFLLKVWSAALAPPESLLEMQNPMEQNLNFNKTPQVTYLHVAVWETLTYMTDSSSDCSPMVLANHLKLPSPSVPGEWPSYYCAFGAWDWSSSHTFSLCIICPLSALPFLRAHPLPWISHGSTYNLYWRPGLLHCRTEKKKLYFKLCIY